MKPFEATVMRDYPRKVLWNGRAENHDDAWKQFRESGLKAANDPGNYLVICDCKNAVIEYYEIKCVCPFCGQEEAVIWKDLDTLFQAGCQGCKAAGPFEETRELAMSRFQHVPHVLEARAASTHENPRARIIVTESAILDVKRGRKNLLKCLNQGGAPIPVLIEGEIFGVYGNDDGVSREFCCTVTRADIPLNRIKRRSP